MMLRPAIDLMLYRCELCGQPQAKQRRVCSRCYKSGKSLRGGICPDCGEAVESKIQTYCHECRDARLLEERRAYTAKRRMSGIERYRMMKVAEKAMKCDPYAQTAAVPSDEEVAVKREKFLALLAADVHVGDYARPIGWKPPEAEYGGFGALAHQHMRGGEAGQGTDRTHTDRWLGGRERVEHHEGPRGELGKR